jgi:hypothetical protein
MGVDPDTSESLPMTTPAQVAANRANASHSTGPTTANGKAAAARNATRHGIFAAVPVLTAAGETTEEWERHRVGVFDSLAPVGLLEATLAERVALLLWRLARVVRYEAAVTAAGLEEADQPSAPSPSGSADPARKTAARLIEKLTEERGRAAGAVAGSEAALALLAELAGKSDGEPVPDRSAALVLLLTAHEAVEAGGCVAPPPFEEEFLRAVGVETGTFRSVEWTAGRVRAGLGYYARKAGWPEERLAAAAAERLTAGRERGRKAEAEAAAQLAGLTAREAKVKEQKKAELMLPADAAEAKVTRYEGHLGRQLQMTMLQLERLQAGRAGLPLVPPLAVEVGVNVAGDGTPAG